MADEDNVSIKSRATANDSNVNASTATLRLPVGMRVQDASAADSLAYNCLDDVGGIHPLSPHASLSTQCQLLLHTAPHPPHGAEPHEQRVRPPAHKRHPRAPRHAAQWETGSGGVEALPALE